MESGEASPSSTAGDAERTPKRAAFRDTPVIERSASPVSTSYSEESPASRPSRPFTARQEEVRWPQRNPHFRAVSDMGFFASSISRRVRTAASTSRLRVTTSAPSPEMEASMARVASPVTSFYVEGEYTAQLHVTTEEEELIRMVGEKRDEFSRLHVALLEREQQAQEVGHVYRKMCLEQDWVEYARLQAHRRAKEDELDGVFRDQDAAWRYFITLKMLLKRMVDLKREMMAMVTLMRDTRVKTEVQIVETNVKLAEATRAKQVAMEELDELKGKLQEERDHRNKELEFLRSGIEDIKESRVREVKRQEKQQEILARMKNEEYQRRMERLRRAKEGFATDAKVHKQEALDELALGERILEATGVSDPNIFLVKMLTREQTRESLENQKARAHEAFERLNQSLETLILHKRELQLEGVDDTYQKRSTGDVESRLIKSEARLSRSLRMFHQTVELIAPVRGCLDTLCSRIAPNQSRDLDRRASFSLNSSMLMGTWAETPKPLTDESRQLEDTLSKMETIGEKLVKLMESIDPTSVVFVESNSRRRSARSSTPRNFPPQSASLSRNSSIRSRVDFTPNVSERRASDEARERMREKRRSENLPESPELRDRPPVQRRSSDFQEPDSKGVQRRSSDFERVRGPADKGPRRRASDFAQSPRRLTGEEMPKRRSAEAALKADAARRSADERLESLVSESEPERGTAEQILDDLVSQLSFVSSIEESLERSPPRKRPESADFAKKGVGADDLERIKTPSEPQVSIQEPGASESGPQLPASDQQSALVSSAKRAMRRTALQQNRAASPLSVSIDDGRTKKQIVPGARLHYPPALEKMNVPKYNFRLSHLDRQRFNRHSEMVEEDAELDVAREHDAFKQQLEQLVAERSGELSDGEPTRLRERLRALLEGDEEEEMGFKHDFARVDLVALRERFAKVADNRKAKSHKQFLKRMINKRRSPDRRKAQSDNKLLGQLDIPGLDTGLVLTSPLTPPAPKHRKPLHESRSQLKGYNAISEKEQKRMLELLEQVKSKPKPRKNADKSRALEVNLLKKER